MIQYRETQTGRVLSPTGISLADAVINPFTGCAFGCRYCYAYTCTDIVSVKSNSIEVLMKELRWQNPRRVLLGSTTECFQYVETRTRLTRSILECLHQHHIPCTILTKSHLIKEYCELLARNPDNQVYMTVNLHTDAYIRVFEKRTPCLAQRLSAVRALVDAGIHVRVHVGPFFAGITDIDALCALLPPGISEIGVELYHSGMGNFDAVCSAVRGCVGFAGEEYMRGIYASAEAYQEFAIETRTLLRRIRKTTGYRIFYQVPAYAAYYAGAFDYLQELGDE